MKQRWKVLVVTSVAVFMGFLDVTIVNIAFPDLEARFSETSLAGLSWVLNAYNIVFAALLVPAGRLADRVGRRRMFFIGIWTFLAASVLCGLAPSVEMLVAARIVQAAGAAILVPTSLALLLPEFPLEQRATATALWGATGAVAAATGPSLGGLLVDGDGWRWVFFVNLAIGPAAVVPRAAPAARDRATSPGPLPDALGASCSSLASACCRWASSRGRTGAGAARLLGSLSPRPALAALVARSARHPAPSIELSAASRALVRRGQRRRAPLRPGFYALLLANILFLTGSGAGRCCRPAWRSRPGRSWPRCPPRSAGRMSDRYGQRVVALPGALLFAAGCLVFATSTGATPDYASEFLPASS